MNVGEASLNRFVSQKGIACDLYSFTPTWTQIPPPYLPDGTYFFVCFEDFSLGPVKDWNDQPKFNQQRAEFWKTTQRLDLPDGSKMDYLVWLQALPRYDLVELIQSGVSFEDMPRTYEFAELIYEATTIEIWHRFVCPRLRVSMVCGGGAAQHRHPARACVDMRTAGSDQRKTVSRFLVRYASRQAGACRPCSSDIHGGLGSGLAVLGGIDWDAELG